MFIHHNVYAAASARTPVPVCISTVQYNPTQIGYIEETVLYLHGGALSALTSMTWQILVHRYAVHTDARRSSGRAPAA